MTTTEAVREHPILFSGPMVRAILDGRKTQTRRVVKPQPPTGFRQINQELGTATFSDGFFARTHECPFGKPGDRLWVREGHWLYGQWVKNGFNNSGGQRWTFQQIGDRVAYTRPGLDEIAYYGGGQGFSWRPSIHMPRWASRITLEITDVRVERLQEISPNDAVAEGVEPDCDHPSMTLEYGCTDCMNTGYASNPRDEFAGLWDSINGQRPGCSWADNPWTWAITFKRVQEAS